MAEAARWGRWTLLPMVVGAGAAMAAQATPPLHVPTHEFTQLFAALAGLGWLLTVRGARMSSAHEVLFSGLIGGFCLGLGAGGTQLVLASTLHGCQIGPAASFFWLTWLPLMALCTVAGVGAQRAGWGRARTLLAALAVALVCVAHDVAQGLLGLRIVDPLIGAAAAIDQRASLDADTLQVLQRGWLLLVAATVWAVDHWRHGGPARPAVSCTAVLALLTLSGGSRLGLGCGSGALEAELDGVSTSANFVVRHPSRGPAAHAVDAVIDEAEWQLSLLVGDWPAPDEPIEVRLYEDDAQVGRLSGFAYPHAWPGGLDLAWPDAFEGTLRHELVHVLQGLAYPEARLLFDRAATEGVAEAWEDDLVWLAEAHGVQAAADRQGNLPDAEVLTSLFGFSTIREGAAYEASASFFGWLVLTRGAEPFAAYQRSGDAQAAWGRPIAQLDTDWRAFLSDQPVDDEAEARARRVFDPRGRPSYHARRCPKLGSQIPDPRRVAPVAWKTGAFVDAAAAETALFVETGAPRFALRAAQAWLATAPDDVPPAVPDLLAQATAAGLGEDEVRHHAELTLLTALRAGETSAIRQHLASLDDPLSQALSRLADHPDDDVSDALATAQPRLRRARIRALVHPESVEDSPIEPDLALLILARGMPRYRPLESLATTPVEREALSLAASLLPHAPSACGLVLRRLQLGARRAAQLGDDAVATALSAALRQTCGGPRTVLSDDRLRQRLQFGP